ncbi:MAG: FAD-binding oxidoreductase [Pseudomonadota bacterium]
MNFPQRLIDIVGDDGVIQQAQAMSSFLVDERRQYQGAAQAIVLPTTVAQTSAVIALCNDSGVGVVPQGGNTGYCGGATPSESGDEIVLCLARMNRLLALDISSRAMTVESGMTLAAAQQAADDAGLLFPLSMGSEQSCQIGGNLSTNAGGLAVLRYGTARELVLGLQVVLADGTVVEELSPLRKNSTGYDVKQLFLGAEGTLGVITAATVKLFSKPKDHLACWITTSSLERACELFGYLKDELGENITSFEYISPESLRFLADALSDVEVPESIDFERHHALMEFSSFLPDADRDALLTALDRCSENGLVDDALVAKSETERRALWRIREQIPAAERVLGGSVKHDISVPMGQLPQLAERAKTMIRETFPTARCSLYGHVGDGNLHFNVLAPQGQQHATWIASNKEQVSDLVHELAAQMQGSFSAEHGVGKLKKDALKSYKNSASFSLMRAVKQSLDPRGIMNPGKVVEGS